MKTWYFHKEAEFTPALVEGIELTVVTDAPSEWANRLIAANFYQTGQAWVRTGWNLGRIPEYLSSEIELREVPGSFFSQTEPEPEPELLILPEPVKNSLVVLGQGSVAGVRFELEQAGQPVLSNQAAREVVWRAVNGELDNQTRVAMVMALHRLTQEERKLPQVAVFTERLGLSEIVGFDYQLRKGELIAGAGRAVEFEGQTGRLAADAYSLDSGAWVLLEPVLWVGGHYTSPNYGWIEKSALHEALGLVVAPEPEPEPALDGSLSVVGGLTTQGDPGSVESVVQIDLFSESVMQPEDDLQVGGEPGVEPEPEVELEPEQELAPAPTSVEHADLGDAVQDRVAFVKNERQQVIYRFDGTAFSQELIAALTQDQRETVALSASELVTLAREEGAAAALQKGIASDASLSIAEVLIQREGVYLRLKGRAGMVKHFDITEQCPSLGRVAKTLGALTSTQDEFDLFGLGLSVAMESGFAFELGCRRYLAAELPDSLYESVRQTALNQRYNDAGIPADVENMLEGLQDIWQDRQQYGMLAHGYSFSQRVSGWEDVSVEQHLARTITDMVGLAGQRKAIYGHQMQERNVDAAQFYDVLDGAEFASAVTPLKDSTRVLDVLYRQQVLQHFFEDADSQSRAQAIAAGQSLSLLAVSKSLAVSGIPLTGVGPGIDPFGGSLRLLNATQRLLLPISEAGKGEFSNLASRSLPVILRHSFEDDSKLVVVPSMFSLVSEASDKDWPQLKGEVWDRMGLSWRGIDGSIVQTALHDSPLQALRDGISVDELLALAEHVMEGEDWRSGSDVVPLENFNRKTQSIDADFFDCNVETYFDGGAPAYKLLSRLALTLYGETVCEVDLRLKHLPVPAIKSWVDGVVAEHQGARFFEHDSTGRFMDRVLARMDERWINDSIVHAGGGSVLALGFPVSGRYGRMMSAHISMDAYQGALLTNPVNVVVDSVRRRYRGLNRGLVTLLNPSHLIYPDLTRELGEVGLIDYLRRGVEPVASMVESEEASGRRKHVDIGVVAGLAIKDLYAMGLRGKNQALRSMTGLQREKVARKEAFCSRPDMQALREAGAKPAIAAFLNKVWGDLPTKPETVMMEDIEPFGKLMAGWSAVLEQVSSEDVFNQLVAQAEDAYTKLELTEASGEVTQEILGMVQEGSMFAAFTGHFVDAIAEHVSPLFDEDENLVDSAMLVADGRRAGDWRMPQPADVLHRIRAGSSIRGFSPLSAAKLLWVAESMDARETADIKFHLRRGITDLYLDSSPFTLGKNKKQTLAGVSWDDLLPKRTQAARKERDTKALVTNHVRVGKNYRNGRDVDGEDFIATFGFSGVEYGKWVSDAERQEHLNLSFDSMCQIAEYLGVEPMALSMGGELGLCFGSRGRGGAGAALAHYEPQNRAINLTRLSGDGSLAHELFHALANHYGRIATGSPLADLSLLMGTQFRGANRAIAAFDSASHGSEAVSHDVRKAFYELMAAILRKPEPGGGSDSDITTYSQRSDMLVYAQKQDAERSKPYWSTPEEMFARAMENMLGRMLAEKDERNDYLVARSKVVRETDRVDAKGVAVVGDLYPTDAEYQRLKPFVEQFTRALKTQMQQVQHPKLGAIEMPVLYSKNKVYMPLTPAELPGFVEHEFTRMFGQHKPRVMLTGPNPQPGSYSSALRLVTLAAGGADKAVVYHEGWHAARDFLLDDDQTQRVDRAFGDPLTARWVANALKESGASDAAIAECLDSPLEAQAYAFELWATGQLDFEQLQDVYEQAKQDIDNTFVLAQSLPPAELEAIFNQVFSGELALRQEQMTAFESPVPKRAPAGMSM